jgi:AcrR family transcriptional regulator
LLVCGYDHNRIQNAAIRQRRKKDAEMNDRRTALLVAAIEEIARKGTRGLRVEEVAKRAGVSPALIYHHFGDRSSLLQAALEHIGEQADAYTAHVGGTSRVNLLAVLVDEIQDNDSVRTNSAAWGELRDTAIFDLALRPTIAVLTQRWVDDIADLVRGGQTDGSIDTELNPDEMGVRLSALVEGISARWLTGILTTTQARDHLEAMASAMLQPIRPTQ